ncbi:MAG: hypothetical protein Q4D96_06920 [Propionibacteriaceae bacterium]|nr:hypothetical protein [Propionibacteriaceae bacterium]
MRAPSLQLPEGTLRVPGSDPEEFRLGALRIEVRRHLGSIDVVLHNTGEQECEFPGLLLIWEASCPVAWLGGGTAMVAAADGASTWRMLSGWCQEAREPGDGPVARLFGDSVRLAPGQRVWSRWRREESVDGFPLPGWVPQHRHLPEGVALEFTDLDVALSGQGLEFETTGTGTLIHGTPGIHRLTVHGPTGDTELEVGWYRPLPDLVAAALAGGETGAGVRAWLLSWAVTQSSAELDERLLDRLDTALAAALERPCLFGVLAGLRAAATTELPVRQEAIQAARALLASEQETEEGAFVLVAALLSGHPELARGFPPPTVTATRQELLGLLEYGLPSSVAPGYTARDVARAQLWLMSHPETAQHLAVAEVTAAARARLTCVASQDVDPVQVAWLLLGEVL